MHDLEIGDDAHALAHARGHTRLPVQLRVALDSVVASAALRHCAIDLWSRSVVCESSRILAASPAARQASVCEGITVEQAAVSLVEHGLLEIVDESAVEEAYAGALACLASLDDVSVWRWIVDTTLSPTPHSAQVGVHAVVSEAERASLSGAVVVGR